MEPTTRSSTSLFDVYLRLRPSLRQDGAPRFIDVENCETNAAEGFPKHITVQPPTESRKRAVEKFAFTRIFEEDASQLDVFRSAGISGLIEGALGQPGRDGRDGLLATLGVTGSGKSHTILGSKSQRGITQMSLDVIFQSIDQKGPPASNVSSLAAHDVSEAQLISASVMLDSLYGEGQSVRGSVSRAQTPMPVESPLSHPLKFTSTIRAIGPPAIFYDQLRHGSLEIPGSYPDSREATPVPVTVKHDPSLVPKRTTSAIPRFTAYTRSKIAKLRFSPVKDASYLSLAPPAAFSRQRIPRPSALPQSPAVDDLLIATDPEAEYAIIISMYEVYNDRIYDLLAPAPSSSKSPGAKSAILRRPLLFKSTEASPDRKVVAGLRKVVCATYDEAIMVLETGLYERKVTGTGSNAVSSRSHGFFCIEIKKRDRIVKGPWSGSTLTIVDLAGSERARVAKTAGATLAEAGKINESLMYLGQCMQMQSDNQQEGPGSKHVVPFRQCKLTELLFSNSFPSSAPSSLAPFSTTTHHHRNPQKGIMIVTADPVGDFNATSQILRYSALAKEVTVPRIPSVTSQMMIASQPHTATSRPQSSCTAVSYPSLTQHISANHTADTSLLHNIHTDLDHALSQITTLTEERDVAILQLTEERQRADTLSAFVESCDERWETREQEIRDECFAEMDDLLEKERRRWKAAWEAEADAADERLDAKIDIVARTANTASAQPTFQIHEDAEKVRDLEDEVDQLKARLRDLERERAQQSPTKRQKVSRGMDDQLFVDLENENAGLRKELQEAKKIAAAGAPIMGSIMRSPSKKMRVLKSKKWEVDVSRDSID